MHENQHFYPGALPQATDGEDLIPESTQQPRWEEQPDGSRSRLSDGIRITDRTGGRPPGGQVQDTLSAVEHLVTWEEGGGRVVVLGLDERCRPVSIATLYSYL